jgi:DNA polymerase-3 subunit beta
MTITIEAGVLSRAMKSASSLIEAKDTIPILANVRLRAIGNELEIITSNSEIEYRQLVPAAVAGDLFTTVDARKLAALAAASETGAQVMLSLAGDRLTAKSGRSRWVLPTLKAETFPEFPFEATGGGGATMPGRALTATIARLAWSICSETTLFYMCGIHIDPEVDVMRFTSVTKNTFATFTSDIPWPGDAPAVIIPTKYARLVERLAAETDAEVTLAWDDRKIRMTMGAITVTGSLIDGKFPQYRRAIPADVASPIIVDPENIRRALRRIEIVGLGKTRCVAMDVQDGTLELQVPQGGEGEASEHVPADCTPLHRAGFDRTYLSGALESVGGDTVEIHQATPNDVAMIRRAVPDGTLCGLMPMRI